MDNNVRSNIDAAMSSAADMLHAMNSYEASTCAKGFLDTVLSDHPTLQQKFIGNVVLNAIREMAWKYRSGEHDARNEAACKICSDMYEVLEKNMQLNDINAWIRLPTV